MTWPVEPLDPATASDGDLAALHALETALELEALPGEPVAPLAHAVAGYRHSVPFRVREGWVVRQGSGPRGIVAWGTASYNEVPENRNHAHIGLAVHPEVRGLGLGSALLERAVQAARRWGCTILDFEARVGGPGEQLCARHDDSGELAGYTELAFPGLWPAAAWQEDTGVWPKHRDRGLGRWLKAANALRLLDERPEIEFIDTWNAGSNEAMLGINEAMGFRPLENWGDWQAETADVATASRTGRA